MKKVVLLTLVCISAMFATACKADSSQKDSNATQPQPKNEIWYTSKDGTIVEPNELMKKYISEIFGANIVSNTYQDGKGVIVFDDDVKSIGFKAFQGRYNLTSISLPEDVTGILKWAFNDCTSLSSITIPMGVTDIGEYAFFNCSSLTSITLPENVTSIGERAFVNCTSLTSIYCKSSCPPRLASGNVFNAVPSDCKLYVPTTSVETYKETEGWRRFYLNIVGYDFQQFDSRKKGQYNPSDEYDVMVEEFALKVDRIEDLILDMSDSSNPFAYVKQIETLAAECEKLHKKLKAAPLDSRQRLYVNEIYADLEDLIRRLTWN